MILLPSNGWNATELAQITMYKKVSNNGDDKNYTLLNLYKDFQFTKGVFCTPIVSRKGTINLIFNKELLN